MKIVKALRLINVMVPAIWAVSTRFKVSSGVIESHISSYGTDFENSETAIPV